MMIPTILTDLTDLTGRWQGENLLWLDPEAPALTSAGTAQVAPVGGGKFVTIHYTWAYEGKAQDGLLLLGAEDDDTVQAIWVDSWHMDRKQMHCHGPADPGDAIRVTGSYAAPPGPDWGWQIVIEPRREDSFRLHMFNVTPNGEAQLAVEVNYQRESGN